MKTTTSAVRTIYKHMISKGAKVATGITGGIYWLRRPMSSTKEDIVVGAVAMNGNEVQEGVFNVNIHVPNMVMTGDNTQPDFDRFDAIAAALMPILANVWGYDWNFKVEEPGTQVPDGNNWFCNIRIRYWTIRN